MVVRMAMMSMVAFVRLLLQVMMRVLLVTLVGSAVVW